MLLNYIYNDNDEPFIDLQKISLKITQSAVYFDVNTDAANMSTETIHTDRRRIICLYGHTPATV